jgi:predicted ATP-grasp superfamily ATP-dependent carboligase
MVSQVSNPMPQHSSRKGVALGTWFSEAPNKAFDKMIKHLPKMTWLFRRIVRGYFVPRKMVVLPETEWEVSFRRFDFLFKHKLVFTMSPSECEYDFVVPITVDTYDTFQREKVDPRRIISPSRKIITMLNDKDAFHGHFSNTPLVKYLPNRDPKSFPLIVKPKIGANSEGCRLISNHVEYSDFKSRMSSDFIAEEYLPGNTEYACHVVSNAGRILDHITIEYSYSLPNPIKGKDSFSKRIIKEPFKDVIEQFLQEIAYSGISCFNYKIRDGLPIIFEINPRIGGSFCEFFLAVIPELSKIEPIGGLDGTR